MHFKGHGAKVSNCQNCKDIAWDCLEGYNCFKERFENHIELLDR